MNWRNYDSVAAQIASAGIIVDPKRGLEVGTPSFVRCKVEGGDRETRGWYRLHALPIGAGEELIVGSFGVWSGNESNPQKIVLEKDERTKISAEQAEAIRARQLADRKSADADLRRRHESAAAKAGAWWRKCLPSGDSAYLSRKGLPPGRLFGARLSPSGNLVIPVQDGDARTWGLQVIYHDPKTKERKGRDKDFSPPGIAKRGHYFVIGSPMAGGVCLLCEGFATGASLHEATALPVVVAFDAGNLLPVAQSICKTYRGLRLLICADDDAMQTCRSCAAWTPVDAAACVVCGNPHGKRNAGIEAAKTAALAVGGHVTTPIFPGERPSTHKGPTDFNDLHVHPDGGLSMVRRQVETSLSAVGWAFGKPARARAPADTQGAGDFSRTPLQPLYTIDEACERWTLLYGSDGAFFDAVDHIIVKKADVLSLIPDHAARDWKQRPDRKVARFSEVGFDPTGKDHRVRCNLWGGWPTTPRAGDCQILLDLLQWMCSLESNAREAYDWVLRWIAYPLQHPGAKMKTTLVFHGLQGAGKNLFFDAVAALYGEYGGTVDQTAVESQFNDWASRKLLLIFDEVVARNELFFLKNRIKALITGDTIRINPKNISAWQETNHCNGIWLSNELHPTAVELFDRRHFIIWTPPALSPNFYRDVAACLAGGGREALHHHLLNLDLGDFDEHSKPPMTDAKLAVQELSMGSIERFYRDWLAGDTPHPVCACSSRQIYRAYTKWCAACGEKARSQNHLSGYLHKQPGWRPEHKDVFDSTYYSGPPKRTRMVVPDDSVLHCAANPDPDKYRKAPDKTEGMWATDCYFAFQASLGDEN